MEYSTLPEIAQQHLVHWATEEKRTLIWSVTINNQFATHVSQTCSFHINWKLLEIVGNCFSFLFYKLFSFEMDVHRVRVATQEMKLCCCCCCCCCWFYLQTRTSKLGLWVTIE